VGAGAQPELGLPRVKRRRLQLFPLTHQGSQSLGTRNQSALSSAGSSGSSLIIAGFSNALFENNTSAYFDGCAVPALHLTDGSLTAQSPTLQSAGAPFVRCDQGASISGADIPAGSTIYNGSGGYESPTTVTMNDNSTCPAECSNVSVTAGAVYYESDTPQSRPWACAA
jgi:hypothetical protein